MKHKNIVYSGIILLLLMSGLLFGVLRSSSKIIQGEHKLINPELSAGEITLITPENKTYARGDSGYYSATYGFENDLDGTIPENWNDLSGVGCSVEVVDEIFEHKKVVELNDSSGNGAMIELAFPNQTIGRLEWWCLSTNVSNWVNFVFYEGETNAIHLELAEARFRYFDSAYMTIGPIVLNNSWYRNVLEFNVMTNKFGWHVYNQTGHLYGMSWDAHFRNTVSNINHLRIKTHYAQSDFQVYIDAVACSWDLDYTIGGNSNEGILLSYDNTTNFDWQGYSLDSGTNKTILGNTTIPMPTDGTHQLQVFGNDTMGTMYESAVRYFLVDTTPPEISIMYPSTGKELSEAPPYVLTITERHIEAMWYTLNGGSNIPFTRGVGLINSTVWNSLADGPITIRFYVRDIGDLEAFKEVIVIKDTSEELPPPAPEIPGYDLYLLLGALGVISALIIRKRVKS